MAALPSSMPINTTTPLPIFFLPSSTSPRNCLAGKSSMHRAKNFISAMVRISSCAASPPIAARRFASAKSRSSFLRSLNNWLTRVAISRGAVFNVSAISCNMVSCARMAATPFCAVQASMRRTPLATALSPFILNTPISPSRRTCVPPQSSTEYAPCAVVPSLPIVSTRTSSPYFSPNNANAPASMASSGVIMRVETASFWRINWFTNASTAASSSSLTGFGWLKSKRKWASLTSDPFCVTCAPKVRRRASCNKCVAL